MCGIIATLSKYNNCNKILINGLKQLQNRGYDSAGIATISDKIDCIKYASTENIDSLDLLEKSVNNSKHSNIGIGHTRWATHGGKTDLNSHPHMSNNKKIVLVHNGIIENYQSLKSKLIENGYKFYSETDSEVIVNLIQYNSETENTNFTDSIKKTASQLSGTWGLVIMNLDEPNKLYCLRQGSPLLVSETGDSVIITSEQSGFNGKVNNYFILSGNDVCVLEKVKSGDIKINCIDNYKLKQTNDLNYDLTPFPYQHWTLKEINEQFDAALRAISLGGRINNDFIKLGGLDTKKDILMKIDNLILLGCGTSYNACCYAKYHFKELCNFNNISVYNGSDFELNDIPKIGKTAVVLVSQSGETLDLYKSIELVKDKDLFLIGMINVVDSLIAREVHCGCYLNAGREVAVASTKSFMNQCILLTMLAVWFSQIHNINTNKRISYINSLRKLPYDIKKTIEISENKKLDILNSINKSNLFILGKCQGESIANEGALKIKEISYIFSEGYSSSSLKHGPFALLDKNTPVIIIAPYDNYYSKNMNTYEEIKTRDAPILFITDKESCNITNSLIIPENKIFSHLLSIIPLQLTAYYLSIKKNINPDKPRNLAKCVTVE